MYEYMKIIKFIQHEYKYSKRFACRFLFFFLNFNMRFENSVDCSNRKKYYMRFYITSHTFVKY